MPIDFTFYPEDKFESVTYSGNAACFRKQESENDEVSYEFANLHVYILTVEKASTLDQVSSLSISKFYKSDPAPCTEFIRQLKHINSVYLQAFPNSDELLLWASSLPSLRKLKRFEVQQEKVAEFLSNLRTTGPLELEFHSNNGEKLSDQLHRMVDELREKKVVSAFKSNWQCACGDECWIKNQ